MKIYHTADIHLRKGRYEEYSQVFSSLFKVLEKNSYFVIAGDILHDSSSLCKDTLDLLDQLFYGLKELNMKVIVIPGNHDFSGPDDILKSVLSTRDIVYLDDKSPLYEFEDIIFYTSSVAKLSKKSNKIKVLIHHSSVIPNLNIRNEATFCFLGDNHSRQFISDTCAYPGSLIQQNFKESKNKGIIVWDTETLSGKFLDIKNDYSYENIIFNENPRKDFEKNCRISIEYKIEDSKNVDNYVQEIKKITNVMSLVKKIYRVPLKKVIKKQEDIFDTMISLHKEEEREKLKDYHKEFVSNSEDIKAKGYSSWKLKEISFEGLYIYEKLNRIVFKDGVTGIIEDNASGKTSIMNIILYAIFGTITKTKSLINRNIINKNSKKYFLNLHILLDNGDIFEIIRKGSNKKRKNGSLSMDESIQLKINDKDVSGSNKIASTRKILEILSLFSRETFVTTNMMNNSSRNILDMKSGEISEMLTKMYSLDYYSKLQEDVNSKLYKIRRKINEIEYCESLVKNMSVLTECVDIEKIKSMVRDLNCDINSEETRKDILLAIDGHISREILIKSVPEGKESLLEEERLLKIYRECVSDKGIPKILLRDYVKNIEDISNSLLESVTDLRLLFIEDQDNKWGFMFKRKNFYLGVESISGFEKFIATVSLKTAIASTCHYSVCDTFFIDESFDCISDRNIKHVDYIFDWLRENGLKKIIIISHNKEISKKIDNRIKISNFSILF